MVKTEHMPSEMPLTTLMRNMCRACGMKLVVVRAEV